MDPGDFHKMFRGFFGLNRPPSDHSGPRQGDREENLLREDRGPEQNREFFNFSVLSDPLEMHRFFEQQMEQMFKDFGGRLDHRGMLENEERDWPVFEGYRPFSGGPSDRDMMLKHDDSAHRRGEDSDFDGQRFSADDLTDLLKARQGEVERPVSKLQPEPRDDNPESIFGGFFNPGGQSFSYSRSTRTIRRPDGSIHTEERCRNPDGSETVKITINGEEQSPDMPPPLPGQPPHPGREFGLFSGGESELHRGWNWPFSLPRDQGEGTGPEFGQSIRTDPDLSAPPADRQYSSLFSKFFGS